MDELKKLWSNFWHKLTVGEEGQKPWASNPVVIFFSLVFLFPIGLWFLFKFTDWTPKTKGWIIGAALVVILVGSKLTPKEEVAKIVQKNQVEDLQNADFILGAALIKEYISNEVAADEKYTGKEVIVVGEVYSVQEASFLQHGTTSGSVIYLNAVEGRSGGIGIECFVPNSHRDKVVDLQPGIFIKVKGKCDGIETKNLGKVVVVVLEDCDFVTIKDQW